MSTNFQPSIDLVLTSSASELSHLGEMELCALQRFIEMREKNIEDAKAILGEAMRTKYLDTVMGSLAVDGKDFGRCTIEINGHKLVSTIGKTVIWDQEKLRAILDALPADIAKHYATVTVRIEEAKFRTAPPEIQRAFIGAREVKPNKPTFKLTKE